MTGSVSAQRKRKPKTPVTGLSPAERAARLLAPRGAYWNFTTEPTPSKKIHVASNKFATV